MNTTKITNISGQELELYEFGIILDIDQSVDFDDYNRVSRSVEIQYLIENKLIIKDDIYNDNAYGEMYEYNSEPIIIKPTMTPYAWKTSILKSSNLITFNNSDTISACRLTINTSGTYRLNFNATLSCNTTNKFYYFMIYKNNEPTNLIQLVKSSGINNFHYPTLSTIEKNLNVNDYYEVFFMASNDNDTFNLYNMSLSLDRISL